MRRAPLSVVALAAVVGLACDLPPGPDAPPVERRAPPVREASPAETPVEAPADGWVAFSSDTARFKARFPSTPDMDAYPVSTLAGEVTQTSYGATLGEAAFAVVYSDYPEALLPIVDLDGAGDAAVRSFDGRVLEQKELTFAGHPAREFEATATNEGLVWRIRGLVFLDGARLYQLMVVHPATMNVDAEKFFTSFELEPRPAIKAGGPIG